MKIIYEDFQALSTVTSIAQHLSGYHEQRAEIIESVRKADEVITKLWQDLESDEQEDGVIRVGDKVIYIGEEYYVTCIEYDEHYTLTFPYKLSKRKEDIGLDAKQLKQKYGCYDNTWQVSTEGGITKVKLV